MFSGNSIVVFVCRFSMIPFCLMTTKPRSLSNSLLNSRDRRSQFLAKGWILLLFGGARIVCLRSSAVFCWRSHGRSDRTCARKAVTLFFGWRQYESGWWPRISDLVTIEKENYPSLHKKLWTSITRVEHLIAVGSKLGNLGMKKKCSPENRQKNDKCSKTRIRNRHQNRFQNWILSKTQTQIA